MTNISLVLNLLSELRKNKVENYILCAGARNSPIVEVLGRVNDIKLYSFFEERSAAFFALGCAKRLAKPVAVVTTSGTAVAELLPAMVEAHHSGVPLVAITADRPARLRGSGAPQAIDQTGLFKKFAALNLEVSVENPDLNFADWNERSPVHINISFDEPLLDAPLPEVRL